MGNTEIIAATSRIQKYENHPNVIAAVESNRDFDMCQIKYDGWWAKVVVSEGVGNIYSRQGVLKDSFPAEGLKDMVMIAEFLKGTNRAVSSSSSSDKEGQLMVFDILEHDGEATVGYCYGDRLNILVSLHAEGKLPDMCQVAITNDASYGETLWQDGVLTGGGEGLVFRRSTDDYATAIIGRVKRTFTLDYVVMAYNEGGGKRVGMAGNLVVGLRREELTSSECKELRDKYFAKNPNARGWKEVGRSKLVPLLLVGGGFNDGEMTDQFDNFHDYLMMVIEVKGWQIFKTGCLRHPNAVRGDDGVIKWRHDKSPVECIWSEAVYHDTLNAY
tara:strand:+ start:325 stop:1314 length:990 start_codon:yes stop_codon:yes gene_type:complete